MTPWRRFGRFNAVGALGIGVQLTVLWVLVDVGRVAYLPATFAAVLTAVFHNFIWHVRWTWGDRQITAVDAMAVAFARFVLANGMVSFIGNLAIMSMLVGGLGLHPVGANLISIALSGVANFWLGNTIVFETADNTKTRFR